MRMYICPSHFVIVVVVWSCPSDGAAVYVHGERAKPLVKNCEIHHSNCVGVFIEDCATVSTVVTILCVHVSVLSTLGTLHVYVHTYVGVQ